MLTPENVGQKVKEGPLRLLLVQKCKELAHVNNDIFPGSQPISLSGEHISVLKQKPFLVCEKSDGVRFLLLIHIPKKIKREKGNQAQYCGIYLVDRLYNFYPVPALQSYLAMQDGKIELDDTLVDGELVKDHVVPEANYDNPNIALDPETNQNFRCTFLVFDAISISGTYVGDLSLFDRLRACRGGFLHPIKMIEGHIEQQRQKSIMQKGTDQTNIPHLPFTLMLKQMYDKSDVSFVFKNIIPNLPHEYDGLIFTQQDKPYIPGTCEYILKWKPLRLNSVDFMLSPAWGKTDSGEQTKRYVYLEEAVGGVCQRYGYIHIPDEQHTKLMDQYRGKQIVVECIKDPNAMAIIPPKAGVDPSVPWSHWQVIPPTQEFIEQHHGNWRIIRIRDDKEIPNDQRVVQKVIQSIGSNIGESTLIKELGSKRER